MSLRTYNQLFEYEIFVTVFLPYLPKWEYTKGVDGN